MTPNALNLDPRQRAMLEEMGVKVWWPVAAAGAATDATSTIANAIETIALSPGNARPAARLDTQTAPVAGLPPALPARASAPTPSPAPAPVATAGSPVVRLETAQRLYDDAGPATGGWLLVVDMPPGPDGRHGAPFDGDAGRLLHNMLRALQLDRSDVPVHLARTHRGAPGGEQPAFGDHFAAQAAALAPRVVLALGPCAAQALLQSDQPLGRLRGKVGAPVRHPDLPLVVSYHPGYLLRNAADKARAWADLCLAAEAFGPSPGTPQNSPVSPGP